MAPLGKGPAEGQQCQLLLAFVISYLLLSSAFGEMNSQGGSWQAGTAVPEQGSS